MQGFWDLWKKKPWQTLISVLHTSGWTISKSISKQNSIQISHTIQELWGVSLTDYNRLDWCSANTRPSKCGLFCLVFAMSLYASVYMCFVVTCWERDDLLVLVCGVYCEFVTSHWYLGSGVILDRIDSWSLHPYLLCMSVQWLGNVDMDMYADGLTKRL